MTQSHRGYIETAVAPEVQSYRDYRPHANVARDPYDSGHSRFTFILLFVFIISHL